MPDEASAEVTTPPDIDPSPDPRLVARAGGEIQSYEDEAAWEEHGREFKRHAQKNLWAIGEWIIAAEQSFDGGDEKKRPDRYTRAAELTDLGYGRLRNLACTVRAFPETRRRDKLSFAHHTVVARRKDADAWLAKAEDKGWNEKTLRTKVRESDCKAPSKARPARIVLSRTAEWERAARAAGIPVKEWLISVADRAANPPDDSGERASA